MKIIPIVSLGLSIVLCVSAVVIVLAGQGEADARPASRAEPVTKQESQTTEVVVAAVDIEAAIQLTPDMLTVTDWPIDHLPTGAITSLSMIDFDPDNAPFTNGVLVAGEPVLSSKLQLHLPRRLLSKSIPEGLRATAIPVRAETAVSGLILPGDHVDVAAFSRIVGENDDHYRGRTLVKKALVLAVDDIFGHEVDGSISAQTVTLALSPAAANLVMSEARSYDLGLTLIGRDELEKASKAPRKSRPVSRPRRASVAAPAAKRAPSTKSIKVILGNLETDTMAPVEGPEVLR